MGSGKTQAMYRVIRKNPDKSYMFVTPYLNTIQDAIDTGLDIRQPEYKGGSKADSLKYLLSHGYNIGCTHSLFLDADDDLLDIIQNGGYTLFIDEALDVIKPVNDLIDDVGHRVKKGTAKFLIQQGIIEVDPHGRVSWCGEHVGDDYEYAYLEPLVKSGSLTTINGRITAKQREITAKEAEISALQSEIDEYASNIRSINDELAFTKFFTEEEQKVLNHYLIENEVTEETFVATDVDISVSGVTSTISGSVNVSGAEIERVNLSGKQMHTIAGGVLTVADANISADIVRGTLEVNTGSNDYVLTAYLGTTTYGDHSFPSGMITMSGKYTQFSSDVSAQYSGELLEYKGSQFTLNVSTSNVFFTVNVNDYQKYSVAQELYEYGAEVLDEYAWPVYEFQIESGNFLFVKATPHNAIFYKRHCAKL